MADRVAPLGALCVFCGSAVGREPAYLAAAQALGRGLAARGVTLVYGGASVGLMGAVADAAIEAGGRVVGVIPRALDAREIAHRGISELHVVESMHQRKALMAHLADAFTALPGGLGTLEELFEVWTWLQLGIHDKPVSLLDPGDYWAPLRAMIDRMVEAGFVRAAQRDALVVRRDAAELLDALGAPARR